MEVGYLPIKFKERITDCFMTGENKMYLYISKPLVDIAEKSAEVIVLVGNELYIFQRTHKQGRTERSLFGN